MHITYSGDTNESFYECEKLCPLDYCLEDLACEIYAVINLLENTKTLAFAAKNGVS